LVFGSAVSYALYLSYSGELVRRLGALRLVGLASCVACVLCVGQFALLRPVSVVTELSADVWWLSALNASLCTVLPVVLVMLSIERIGSALASQAGMVGPMSTLVMAALVLDEPLSPWLLLGTALVMSGVFICSRGPELPRSGPPSQVE
jgi:drug/metabolite transporter (DMT)-like permease